MFERVLKKIRDRVRAGEFVVTLHAVEELEDENSSVLDAEHVILTGSITERQKDAGTGEWKYLVRGHSLSSDELVVVTKLSRTNKLVIITVYGDEERDI